MIVCNRNDFLRITIVFIIVTFSKQLSVQRTRDVREDIYHSKTNADNESNPGDPYYHRNDIGHLNEYYQERMKLRKQFNTIQKAMHEKKVLNITTPKNAERPPITNSFDTFHSLNPGPQDVNQIQVTGLNATEPNVNSTIAINNTELRFQNETYIKIGKVEGVIIYRQNILITGANYDAINGYSVDVNLEGICITGIEIFSKNGEKVKVTLTSGGPGKANTSLRFEDLNKNINLSYVLKVWGISGDC